MAVEPPTRAEPGAPIGQIVVSLIIPIVGVICAIVLFAQNRVGHGLAVLLTSAIGAYISLVLLFGTGG